MLKVSESLWVTIAVDWVFLGCFLQSKVPYGGTRDGLKEETRIATDNDPYVLAFWNGQKGMSIKI